MTFHRRLSLVVFALVFAIFLTFGPARGASAPRAKAVEFEEKVIFHPPENPGFAAWVQL